MNKLVKTKFDALVNPDKRTNRTLLWAFLAIIAMAPSQMFAVAPLDLSDVGEEIGGYVATAAAAGVVVLAAIWGIRIIIKAFKSVAK